MAPQEINVRETIYDNLQLLDSETEISPAFRSMFKLLLVLVEFLAKQTQTDQSKQQQAALK